MCLGESRISNMYHKYDNSRATKYQGNNCKRPHDIYMKNGPDAEEEDADEADAANADALVYLIITNLLVPCFAQYVLRSMGLAKL